MKKHFIILGLLSLVTTNAHTNYDYDNNISKLHSYDITPGMLNNGVAISGKKIGGYDFDLCLHENTRINYCTPKNAKKIISLAESQKSKSKFLNKYTVVSIPSDDNLTKSFMLVDVKNKKIVTSGLEYDIKGKITFSTNQPVLYVDTEITNGFSYHGGSRSHGSLGEQTPIYFMPKNRVGDKFSMYGDYEMHP